MSMSNTISSIRRGDPNDFDPEDFRQAGRIRRLRALLVGLGVPQADAEVIHTDEEGCILYENRTLPPGSNFRRGYCSYKCKRPPIPDWVTTELMQKAYDLSYLFHRAKVEANR